MKTFSLNISVNRTGKGWELIEKVDNLKTQSEAIKIIAEPKAYINGRGLPKGSEFNFAITKEEA